VRACPASHRPSTPPHAGPSNAAYQTRPPPSFAEINGTYPGVGDRFLPTELTSEVTNVVSANVQQLINSRKGQLNRLNDTLALGHFPEKLPAFARISYQRALFDVEDAPELDLIG